MNKHLSYVCSLILMSGIALFFNNCSSDDNDDWSETINLIVAPEIVDFYPFENDGIPSDGMNVREERSTLWIPLPLTFIEGFEYEAGYEYKLKVIKTHLSNPPMDGFSFTYILIEVIAREQ